MSADEQTPDATEVVEILKGVVDTFASKEDMKAAREAGQIISDLEADANDKHQEMLQSIKGAHQPCPRAMSVRHAPSGAPATQPSDSYPRPPPPWQS